jgi:hypothetical protein
MPPSHAVQGEAIAVNLREMFGFNVPILSVVIGEGGSGGALAIGCANHNLIMEHSVYYVASPEACAAILWKSRDKAAAVRAPSTHSLHGVCQRACAHVLCITGAWPIFFRLPGKAAALSTPIFSQPAWNSHCAYTGGIQNPPLQLIPCSCTTQVAFGTFCLPAICCSECVGGSGCHS